MGRQWWWSGRGRSVRVALWSLVLFALVLNLASGQSVFVAEREPLPDKPPQSAPEQRRRLSVDPDAVFTKLVARDAGQVSEALDSLGMSWLSGSEPTDVRFLAVKLDADPDLERVLIVKTGAGRAAASVFKKLDGVWWELGSFGCCAIGGTNPDPFVELRDTVWPGTKDIVAHQGGAQGTGVGEWRLLIYRVWKGQLYKVFDIVESAYNLVESESSQIAYPDTDSYTAPRIIIVDRTTEREHRRAPTCIKYRWDPDRFAFLRASTRRGSCGSER
jgi:hypothetical protein